jgi:uncharacterized membrane protein YbhN (UPF0104 family)
MKPDAKSKTRTPLKWISILGTFLVLLSFYYIGTQLWGYREALTSWTPTTATILPVAFGIITYALANYLLAAAWIGLLRVCGESNVDWRSLCRIYGKSQIAKYIPGNIAHIAGRHTMGRLAGLSHSHLAVAAVYEIIGLVSAALIITLMGGKSVLDQFTSITWWLYGLPFIIAGYLVTPWLLKRFRPDTPSASALLMLRPLIYYMLFFLVSGIALAVIGLYSNSFPQQTDYLIILSAFAIAWSVGFLTPGAPSGIGIREAILIILLSPSTGDANALMLALIFRLVTIGGDSLFYLFSLFCARLPKGPAPQR